MSQKYILKPRLFGFICTTAHPVGCHQEVLRQIEHVSNIDPQKKGGNMLVIGSSMGYGLSTRITGAFGYGMNSLGVAFERPAKGKRTATAGWYNTAAFHKEARARGLFAETIIGDAFSRETLELAMDKIASEFGQIDYLVYSLAAPRRTDPATGIEYSSALKAVGNPFETPMLDTRSGEVSTSVFEAATMHEIDSTVAVMGGKDLKRWTTALLHRSLLNEGCRTLAYSYVGPPVTQAIYRDGTIGQAKKHLEKTCVELDKLLKSRINGSCNTVVAKSLVTQSSSAIPAIALYIGIVFNVMKEQGLHEDTIQQMRRLFVDHISPENTPSVDSEGRIRIDDLELLDSVQNEVDRRWAIISTDNLEEYCDYRGYHEDFLRIFGFGLDGIDYMEPVNTDLEL
jgi:enoyl-[acyl-carrier protein] reductase / trans-2-enoyl-CoA reductase (NAD+)